MAQFFAMGGYARFVWPAYGVAVIVLAGLLAHSLIGYRRAQRALDVEERR
ncbi:MAG TPA: heme exporter protein CcmD [Stellaceae bacterium]|nr:heme exporter protein CcmD [Stellaceae bacterium]